MFDLQCDIHCSSSCDMHQPVLSKCTSVWPLWLCIYTWRSRPEWTFILDYSCDCYASTVDWRLTVYFNFVPKYTQGTCTGRSWNHCTLHVCMAIVTVLSDFLGGELGQGLQLEVGVVFSSNTPLWLLCRTWNEIVAIYYTAALKLTVLKFYTCVT